MFRACSVALKKSLVPVGERVLVKRAVAAKETKSGLLIPTAAAGKMNEGTVVAVAAGTKDWTPVVKAGDVVLLPEFGGHSIKLDGEEFQLFEEASILGVIKSE
jgi:chaperonin GroES